MMKVRVGSVNQNPPKRHQTHCLSSRCIFFFFTFLDTSHNTNAILGPLIIFYYKYILYLLCKHKAAGTRTCHNNGPQGKSVATSFGPGFLISGCQATGCGCRLPIFEAKNRTGPDLRTLISFILKWTVKFPQQDVY